MPNEADISDAAMPSIVPSPALSVATGLTCTWLAVPVLVTPSRPQARSVHLLKFPPEVSFWGGSRSHLEHNPGYTALHHAWAAPRHLAGAWGPC